MPVQGKCLEPRTGACPTGSVRAAFPTRRLNRRHRLKRLRKLLLLTTLLFISCNPLRGCAENSFQLVPESRLPKWLTVPSGYRREQLEVWVTDHVPLTALVDDVVVRAADHQSGRLLITLTGRRCEHPRIDQVKRNQWGGFDPGTQLPGFTIIIVNSVMEVIKHDPPGHEDGGWFAITDDDAVVKEAEDSIRRGECRKS